MTATPPENVDSGDTPEREAHPTRSPGLVGIWEGIRRAPRLVHCICWRLTKRLLMTVFTVDSARQDEMRLPARNRTQSWDIALTDAGPVPLEVNFGGDLNLTQLASGAGVLDATYRAHLQCCGYRL